MATQVQIRRATQSTQEARTLVSGELDANTTDNRISLHNGSTAGGVRHINMYDQQNSEFNYASTSGTNAITASMRIAPQSYTAGQVFWLKISNTNTGSCTLNINSLGAKTVKKVFNNALSNLSANDLISGQMVGVFYDGTYFQIVSGSSSEFGKQSWIPNSVTSYTASRCNYVEYGDSVTVSFEVVMTSDTTIGNLPFSPTGEVSFVIRNTFDGIGIDSGYDFARIESGSNTIKLNHTTASDGDTIRGQVTYIKG